MRAHRGKVCPWKVFTGEPHLARAGAKVADDSPNIIWTWHQGFISVSVTPSSVHCILLSYLQHGTRTVYEYNGGEVHRASGLAEAACRYRMCAGRRVVNQRGWASACRCQFAEMCEAKLDIIAVFVLLAWVNQKEQDNHNDPSRQLRYPSAR